MILSVFLIKQFVPQNENGIYASIGLVFHQTVNNHLGLHAVEVPRTSRQLTSEGDNVVDSTHPR
jgi:hypothetical protein